MQNYNYRVIASGGKKVRGTIKASSIEGAQNVLKKQNFTIISVEEVKKSSINFNFLKKVSLKDKIIFTEQLSVMIKSGLSVVEALKSLEGETTNKYFQNAIAEIRSQVESGLELSKAMSNYPKIFPEVYVQMVMSGEISGSVDQMLKKIAVQQEKDYELMSKVKSAMIYPVIVMILLVGVIVIVLTFIIPKLKGVFEDAGTELPITTKILVSVSNIFAKYLWLIIIIFIALIFLFRFVTSRGRGQHIWHKIKLKLPVFGNLHSKIILARFTQGFAALNAAGVPILKIFETTQNIVTNVIIKEDLIKIAQDVKNGVPMSFAFRKSKHFPSMISQLAAVGEKSGDLQEVFEIVSNFYEKEVDNLTKNLSAAIEPLIMIIMGLGVGFILMAVLQPIYGLVNSM